VETLPRPVNRETFFRPKWLKFSNITKVLTNLTC